MSYVEYYLININIVPRGIIQNEQSIFSVQNDKIEVCLKLVYFYLIILNWENGLSIQDNASNMILKAPLN